MLKRLPEFSIARAVWATLLLLTLAAAAQADDDPIGTPETALQDANRIGALRNWEKLFPTKPIPAGTARALIAAERLVLPPQVDAFLRRSKATGLIVLQDGFIRYEDYWLGADASSRFTSMSMAKSLTGVLTGFAIADGAISSVDDQATSYLPELEGSGYDGVTIGDLLQMSSGVAFDETPGAFADATAFWEATAIRHDTGMLAWARRMTAAHPAGTAFKYSGVDTSILGLAIARATGKSLAAYAAEKLWRPAGLETAGAWALDGDGQELPYCCISATLRDYARLGLFLLTDPGIAGWMTDSATPHRPELAPGRLFAGYPLGYGYQWWLSRHGYMAHGAYGQFLELRPREGLVIVLTSAWDLPWDYALEAEAYQAFDAIAAAFK